MKKLVIELSDEQHTLMMEHIKRGQKINYEEETFSGFSINLCSCEFGDWLDVDMYGVLNLGDVSWEIV
jgi:hypothetical protein